MGKSFSGQDWALLADTQTGSSVGLTPEPKNKTQSHLLEKYQDAIQWFGHRPDCVLHAGETHHGLDPLSHDLTEHDPFLQAELSAKAIAMWNARREYVLLTGSKYHTNIEGYCFEAHVAQALENILARRRQKSLKVSVRRKLNTTINGWFHLEARHKIGKSVVPYGRGTAPSRFVVWNALNAAMRGAAAGKAPDWPTLSVFGHVHYWLFIKQRLGAALILPCWQALGCRYGDEECEGHIDVGMVRLTVSDAKGDWVCQERLYEAAMVSRVEHR